MNKLCDAADWADPDLQRIIRDEFREVPRFHRKQWEFAVIYRALERRGLLHEAASGISFGSATEVMLYAVARHVRHLWATDLYGADAVWDIARTSDPTQLVRSRAPFDYPAERLSARSMDMREIAFPDQSFDFAYSSCAIEHIGAREDFVRHLREVRRVLKPGGVYAFTTEFTFADRTIECPGNHYFARDLLESIVRDSGLWSDGVFDARLAHHRANTPLPAELMSGVADGDGRFTEQLFGTMLALHMLSADLPFTSCLVVLHKRADGQGFGGWQFEGWEQSRRFIAEGVGLMRGIVEGAELRLAPFAWMPARRSPYFLGHEQFFERKPAAAPAGALFHSGYFWLGGGRRPLRIALQLREPLHGRLRLKIHRARGSTPWQAELQASVDLEVAGHSLFHELLLDADAGCLYAVLAEPVAGAPRLLDVAITCAPAGSAPLSA